MGFDWCPGALEEGASGLLARWIRGVSPLDALSFLRISTVKHQNNKLIAPAFPRTLGQKGFGEGRKPHPHLPLDPSNSAPI
jgi:hypothetical protein